MCSQAGTARPARHVCAADSAGRGGGDPAVATVPSFALPFCFFGLLLCDLLYESRILLDPRGKLASIVERFVLGASRSNQSDPPWVSYSRLRFTPTNKSTTRHTKIHARKIHRPLPLFIFIKKSSIYSLQVQ